MGRHPVTHPQEGMKILSMKYPTTKSLLFSAHGDLHLLFCPTAVVVFHHAKLCCVLPKNPHRVDES